MVTVAPGCGTYSGVKIDNVAVPPVTTGATVWSAEERRNAVLFAPLYVPQPGSTVTIQYTAVCGP